MITTNLKFKIEKTKDNYDILRINKNNKWIYIGSKYNMKNEIDKFLEQVGYEDDPKRVFLIYGFAAGEHIKALRNKFKENKILVFEPNIELREFITGITWVNEDENLEVICCEQDDLIDYLSKYIEEYNLDYSKFIYFSNYNIYTEELKKLLDKLKNYFIGLRINRNTRMFFSKRWFETLINNIPYMVNGTPVDLYKDKYKNKPAIIVSAGPSLEKNIDQLKELNNDMLIISGGRTLRSLIDKGINPGLLAVADPGEISYELVEGYIENLNIPLLFYEGTNEKVVSNHKGEKIFFSNNSFIDRISEKNLIQFSSGGSVSHSMTSCALLFGCNPIIFIGQDLAYTDDKKYSLISQNRDGSGTFDETNRNNDIWVEDINGEKIRTSLDLNQFRIAFENIIKENPNTKFINSTEGGARIHGTTEMPLCEAIKKYKGEKLEPIKKINYPVNLRKNSIELLEEAKESAQLIINKSKKSLRYIDDLKTYYIMKKNNLVNSILKKLDKIDEEIKNQYINVELVESLLYPIIYETLSAKSIKSDDSNLDNMNYIIEENKKLYTEFLNQLEYASKHIDETLLKLKEDK